MKIGIDTLSQTPFGSGGLTYIRSLIKGLSRINPKLELFIFTSKTSSYIFKEENESNIIVDCFYSNENPVLRILSQQVQIPLVANRLKIDVLLCPSNTSPIFSNIPVLLVIQNRLQYDLPKEYGYFKRLYNRILGAISLKQSAVIVAVSNDLASFISKRYNFIKKKIHVVHEGVDLNSLKDVGTGNNIFFKKYRSYILNVGNLWPHKNLEVLLKAYAYCVHNFDIVQHLLIAGKSWSYSYDNSLISLIKELNVENRVHLLGFVHSKEINMLYSAADILVLPSLYESFCLPILEAMAVGTPVIVSNITALPEIAGEAGMIIAPPSYKKFARGIMKILNDSDYRDILISRGYERVKYFSWDVSAEKISKLLHDL